MNPRQRFVRLGLVAVPAVAVGLWFLSLREPAYQGKSLSEWVEALASKDEEARALAAEAIRQIGGDAVPHLLSVVRAMDTPFERKVLQWRFEIAQWFWERAGNRTRAQGVGDRWEARFKALLLVGHAAAPHMPEFVKLLRKEVWIGALLIQAVGAAAGQHPAADEAASILVTHLGKRDADTSVAVRGALRSIGPRAVPALTQVLESANELGRRWAADLLGHILENPEIAVPALIRSLADKDPNVRRAAIGALDQFEAREAIPGLRPAVTDGDDGVRRAAISALARFADRESIPALRQRLADEHVGVRVAAAMGLANLGVHANECLNVLRDAVEKGDTEGALSTLIKLAPNDSEIISRLTERLDAASVHDVVKAAEALGKIGPAAKPAIPALLRVLSALGESPRAAAASALAGIGPAATDAIPDLIRALRDTNKEVRVSATRALAQIDPDALDVAAALVAGLNDKEKDVRASAAEALGHLASPNRQTVVALGRSVEDGSHRVRLAAIKSLERLGPKAKAAVRFLHRGLQDTFPSVRDATFRALRKIDRSWPVEDL